MKLSDVLDDDIKDYLLAEYSNDQVALLIQLVREMKSLHSTLLEIAGDVEAIRTNTR